MTAQDVDVSTSYRQQEAGKADGVTRTTDMEKKIKGALEFDLVTCALAPC